MDILQELQRSGLNISPITSNAISNKGLGGITFKSATLKYPDLLQIDCLVESSDGNGNEKHFSNNGDSLVFSGGYRVSIQFVNFGSIAPPNLLSLPLSQQIIYIKNIFDKADVKVDCDCGAFYWQGTHELLDRNPPEAAKNQFTGQQGRGIWDLRHNTKNRICKHIYHVLEEIESYIPKILKSINKGTSISTSTVQQVPVQAPQQPAGTPAQSGRGVEKVSTINSEKAEQTVESDIEEKQSAAESLDLPNLDISKVKAKSHEDESDVISGAEDSEPPIEEITIAKEPGENEKTEDEELERELPNIIQESADFQIKSALDFQVWKKWKSSEAYLYISFDEFKNDIRKKAAQKHRSFKDILSTNFEPLSENFENTILRKYNFEKLDEANKNKLLKALLAAGLISAATVSTMALKPMEQKTVSGIERQKIYPDWVYEEALPAEELDQTEKIQDYKYANPKYKNTIEKYKGEISPKLIEIILQAESKYGKHVKYDSKGAGIMQVSAILVNHYNEVHKTNYSHKNTWYNDDLNIRIGCWFLNYCKEYADKRNFDADDLDLYLMYNNGARGYISDVKKYRRADFSPLRNFERAKEIINSQI
jgi:hypothetical protein